MWRELQFGVLGYVPFWLIFHGHTEFFKMDEIRSKLENAQNLILHSLPDVVRPEVFEKVKNEMELCPDHLMTYLESTSSENNDNEETPVTFQEIFKLSNETLMHLYDFASSLVRMGKFSEANDLFLFLTTLSPQITSFWIGQGVCLQALKQYDDALAVYETVKFLTPSDPKPYAYSIEIHQILKEKDKEKGEASNLERVINSLNDVERVKIISSYF